MKDPLDIGSDMAELACGRFIETMDGFSRTEALSFLAIAALQAYAEADGVDQAWAMVECHLPDPGRPVAPGRPHKA